MYNKLWVEFSLERKDGQILPHKKRLHLDEANFCLKHNCIKDIVKIAPSKF